VHYLSDNANQARYLSYLSRPLGKGGKFGNPPPAVCSDADSGFFGGRLSGECCGGHTKSRYFDGHLRRQNSLVLHFLNNQRNGSKIGRRHPLDIEKIYLLV
jgi:hypothetical protein